jgi:hypothetical protein
MSSRDRCELRWRYGLARHDSSIKFFVNPALPIEPHRIIRNSQTPNQNN